MGNKKEKTPKQLQHKKNKSQKKEEAVPQVSLQKTIMDSYRLIAQERFRSLFGDLAQKDLSKVKLEESSVEKPFVIPARDAANPNVLVLNSPLIGMRKRDASMMDMFKNALRYAEKAKCDAVFVTGNVIHFMNERYGKERPRKTLSVDIPPKADIIKKSYPKFLQDEKSIERRLKDGDPIFFPPRIQLDHVFDMLQDAFVDEKGAPLYSGPVYVVMGEMEESLINYFVNETVRVIVWQEKAKVQERIRGLNGRLRKLKQRGEEEAAKGIEEMALQLHQYNQIWATMGNVPAYFMNDLVRDMQAYLTLRLEELIPNCKVAGIGSAFFAIAARKITVLGEKNYSEIKGGLAGKIRRKTLNFIKNRPGDNVPDALVCMGLNPYCNGLFVSHRVASGMKTLDDVPMRAIVQAPTCLNARLYRDIVMRLTKIADKATRVAATSNFESGAIVLRWFGDGPLFGVQLLKSDYLLNSEVFQSDRLLQQNVDGEHRKARIIYAYKEGCTHYGAMNIATYPSAHDEERPIKFHYQVVFEMLEKWKAPIHMFQNDGDTQHWLNYQVYKEGRESPLPEEFLKRLNEIANDTHLTANDKCKELKRYAWESHIKTGVLQPEEQVQGYADSLIPYLDFFINMINRASGSRILTAGDCGMVVFGQGNHNENTFKRGDVRFSEARMTREAFLARMLERITGNSIAVAKRSIYAGVYLDLGLTRGLFGVLGRDKKYEDYPGLAQAASLDPDQDFMYAIFMKHKQGSSKLEDNMAKMIAEFASRGTADKFEVSRFCVNLAGDDHMGGFALTRNALHLKTGGQQFEGAFGLRLAFPWQNIFSAVWGVPAGGPAWGPMNLIFFDYRAARKYAAQPYKVNADKVFPNPAK